jgi:hypothetical protein
MQIKTLVQMLRICITYLWRKLEPSAHIENLHYLLVMQIRT